MSSKPGVWFTLLPATRNLKMRFARYLATLNLRHEHPSKSAQQKPWVKFIIPSPTKVISSHKSGSSDATSQR